MVGLTLASIGTVAAMPNYLRDNEQIVSALDSADYDEFITELELVNPQMAEHMSEFRFERMIEQNDRLEAIENNDYSVWVATFADSRYQPTQEDFNEMVERHNNHLLVEEALEVGDYETWKTAVEKYDYGRGMSNVITEEDFNTMREIHLLREEGNYEGASALALEQGFGMNGNRMHEGLGKGMNQGMRDGSSQGMGSGQELRDGFRRGQMKGMGIHR